MSVTQIIAKATERSGEADSDGRRAYHRRFLVVVNDPRDGPQTVMLSLGINPFDIYAGFDYDVDVGARIKRLEVKQRGDDPYYYDVLVEFDSKVEQFPLDPLARPTLIYYGFSRYGQVVWQDVFFAPIMNSAGEYYDPPPEVDRSRLQIKMVRNEAVFDPNVALAYQDAVNSDVWFGIAPGLVRVNITGDPQQENGEYFYQVTYEFELRWDGWQLSILDQGRYAIPVSGGQPVRILDADGAEVTDPVPLDGQGGVLANYSPTNAVYRTHNVYRSVPFAPLALP